MSPSLRGKGRATFPKGKGATSVIAETLYESAHKKEKDKVMIKGTLISLEIYTRERCHKMYTDYKSDPMMTEDEYIYDENKVDKYYDLKVKDETRRFFAIVKNERVIGEIQLKYINFEEKFATLSVILMNDSVKNKGYGTEAEKLVLEYAKKQIKFRNCICRRN